MRRAVLTRSHSTSLAARRLILIAALGIVCPASISRADPVRISVQTLITGFAEPCCVEGNHFSHASTDLGGSNLDATALTLQGTTAMSSAAIAWNAGAAGFAATGLTHTTVIGTGDLNATADSRFGARFSVLEPVTFKFSGFSMGTPTV